MFSLLSNILWEN